MLTRRLCATTALAILALAALTACGTEDGAQPADTATETTTEPSADAGTVQCDYPADGTEPAREVEPPSSEAPATGTVVVSVSTNVGDFDLTLDAETTPCTVHSFVSLAEQGFYDDTPCPRLANAPGFGILQCGDPSGTTAGGPGYTFADELTGGEAYPAGTLAMANAGPDTNGSQFFFVFSDTQLSPDYTVFGTFDETGIQVMEKVAEKGDDGSNPAGGGAPNQPVTIERVEVG